MGLVARGLVQICPGVMSTSPIAPPTLPKFDNTVCLFIVKTLLSLTWNLQLGSLYLASW